MKVRRLNDHGLNEFSDFINQLRRGAERNIPSYLLEGEEYSEHISIDLDVGDLQFDTRYELGNYLVKLLEGEKIQNYMGDAGFWSWFALFWFEQLCPIKAGSRKPSMEYNYILSRKYNHRPRHAIYMTWQLVSRYGEGVRFMLCKELSVRGEITEELMARQEILSAEGVMMLASELYTDNNTGLFKKGATSGGRAGAVHRYVGWLQQLQMTYDIFSTSKEELAELLPSEFDRFRCSQ